MEIQALGQLASTGIVGAFLVLALLALRTKDKELSDEKALRIKDSQDMMQLAMKIQSSVIDAVHKLGDIVDSWEKRDDERERRRDRSERPPVGR
jgi:uncharacterized metal-binding protein